MVGAVWGGSTRSLLDYSKPLLCSLTWYEEVLPQIISRFCSWLTGVVSAEVLTLLWAYTSQGSLATFQTVKKVGKLSLSASWHSREPDFSWDCLANRSCFKHLRKHPALSQDSGMLQMTGLSLAHFIAIQCTMLKGSACIQASPGKELQKKLWFKYSWDLGPGEETGICTCIFLLSL